MPFSLVSSISPLDLRPIDAPKAKENTPAPSMFADIFQSAIENVRQTDAEKNQQEYLLSVGELDNPAELTISATKAQTAVELLVQLRSKSLEAYNEIMRISV